MRNANPYCQYCLNAIRLQLQKTETLRQIVLKMSNASYPRLNDKAYHDYLAKNHREAYAHFVTLVDGTGYKRMLLFINKELPKTYKQIIEFIQSL